MKNYIYNISLSLGLLVDTFTSHLNSGDRHVFCKAITLGSVSYLDGEGESLSSSSLREREKRRSTVDTFTSHLNSGDRHALCKAITLGSVSYLDGEGESLSSSSLTPLREREKRSTVVSLSYIHVSTHMYLLQYGENYIYNISLSL